jgi:hypothetical protein
VKKFPAPDRAFFFAGIQIKRIPEIEGDAEDFRI